MARVVRDPHHELWWTVRDGTLAICDEDGGNVKPCGPEAQYLGGWLPTAERMRVLLDLMTNPTGASNA